MKNDIFDQNKLKKLINEALDEDLGVNGQKNQDITSNLTILDEKQVNFTISNRKELILCGSDIVLTVFNESFARFSSKNELFIKKNFQDGQFLPKNSQIITGIWDAKSIFACERVALNLIQHLSGIATKTHHYIKALNNPNIKILDTRKTLPGLRYLQKYAHKTGGGQNHRFGLNDAILIKDNHIAAAGNITNAVNMVKKGLKQVLKIEIECDNLDQVQQAVDTKVDIIMLDNMSIEKMQKAIKIINKKAKIEVSGNITMEKLPELSNLDIDYISCGSLTHSVQACDIGLDIL